MFEVSVGTALCVSAEYAPIRSGSSGAYFSRAMLPST